MLNMILRDQDFKVYFNNSYVYQKINDPHHDKGKSELINQNAQLYLKTPDKAIGFMSQGHNN